MDAWAAPQFSSRDIATIALNLDTNTVYLCSAYWDGSEVNVPKGFEDLVLFCNAQHFPLVIAIDSNAHNVMWGCEVTDNRGELLENNLFPENKDSPYFLYHQV